MHFVLTLHSHLPYVLNHGRWPHGSDWLCEATLDTYLPLLEALRALASDEVPAPVTLGITPVLANQLANPLFAREMEAFFQQRLLACAEAPASLEATGDEHLLPLVAFWQSHISRMRELFLSVDGNLVAAFRRLEEEGRLEIIGSAATHGFLPLLGRDESIRLQLAVGVAEHRRLVGRAPRGCWVPECAYRPGGSWDPIPGVSRRVVRPGVEEYLEEVGFRYFFVDTHMVQAGESLGAYGDVPHGTERFDLDWHGVAHLDGSLPLRSPYRAYRVSREPGPGVAAFVRDPRSSMQVWSRHHGYPGDGNYLEFHKIRWPGGLKFWRVTGPSVDLGEKGPYDPRTALARVEDHAAHFAYLLGEIQAEEAPAPGDVTMAPFDTELLGHWWFEGVDFFHQVFRQIHEAGSIQPTTASEHLVAHPPRHVARPLPGSWGANGDWSMWLNPDTRWTWELLWPLEDAFWDLAAFALGSPERRPILAQAARQLLLAQASDWQFMISTGAVPDYAEKRFNLHCRDLAALLEGLSREADTAMVEKAGKLAAELEERDQLFPHVLDSVEEVLARSGVHQE